jgi:hypothetical protein
MNGLLQQLETAKTLGDLTMVRLILDQIAYVQLAGSLEPQEAEHLVMFGEPQAGRSFYVPANHQGPLPYKRGVLMMGQDPNKK